MVQYFPVVTGSLTVTGSINVSGGITASGGISIPGSIASASFASTASFVALAQSASNAVAAATSSFADAFTVAGNLTAQTLVVQTITSSVDFVTGSTRFGSIAGNTHQFTGSVSVSGSGAFNGTLSSLSNFISDQRTDTISVGTTAAANSTYNYLGYSGYWGLRTTSTGFNFALDTYNGGTPKNVLIITQAGNTIIGSTNISNGHKLEVVAGSQSGLRIDVTSGYSAIAISPGGEFNIDKPGVGGGTFKINSDGNVGINTNSPSQKLTVAGTVSATDLILQGSSNLTYSYTTNSSWASGFQTIIPLNGAQATGAVYLVKVNWGSGGSPYVVYGAFLWVCMGSNGGGADNTITPMISTHQGGTGTMNFRNIAGGGQVASGVQVQLIGFANPDGSLGVTATRLM